MKARSFLLALALSTPVVLASENNELIVDLEKSLSRFWVESDKPLLTSQAVLLKFSHLPIEYSSPAKLEILVELPTGHVPGEIAFKFSGGEEHWPIEDYAYHSGNRLDVFLPQLKTNQKIEFSFGWPSAPFDQARAYALLTTDSGQFFQQWIGGRFAS